MVFIKVLVRGNIVSVISVYAPQCDLDNNSINCKKLRLRNCSLEKEMGKDSGVLRSYGHDSGKYTLQEVTCESSSSKTKLDYCLVRKHQRKFLKDFKVVVSKDCVTQNILLRKVKESSYS